MPSLSRNGAAKVRIIWEIAYGSGLFPFVSPIRIALEEVIIQQITNFEQQVRIDPRAVEDLVGVLPRKAELLGEPSDAAPLSYQFFLDEVADVRFFLHCVCRWWSLARVGKQNGRNRFDCLLETEGSAKPVKANNQQTAHALRREPFATYSSFTSNLPIFGLENKSVKLDLIISIIYLFSLP